MTDRVLGGLPTRQWVLTLPYRLRYALAWDHRLCRAVLAVFARAVLGFQRRRARRGGVRGGAGVWYVDGGAPAGGDGRSWPSALRFVADALAAARDGDTIDVAQGTYQPDRSAANPEGSGNRSATFQLRNGVALRGGYAGLGAADPDAIDLALHPSTLSDDLAGDDGVDFESSPVRVPDPRRHSQPWSSWCSPPLHPPPELQQLDPAAYPRIVNGLTTRAYPAVGLLRGALTATAAHAAQRKIVGRVRWAPRARRRLRSGTHRRARAIR